MRNLFLLGICLLLNIANAQTFPGGVPGPEVWFKVNHAQNSANTYTNSGLSYIPLSLCTEHISTQGLYNFNDSMNATKLCMSYSAPLENVGAHNIFFVGEDFTTPSVNTSYVTTGPNTEIPAFAFDSIRNRFSFAYQNALGNKMLAEYVSAKANINFYHYNQYDTDKKVKSYGYFGETKFFIGKEFTNPINQGVYYSGNFPEYIAYPFELNANERQRVESYLALKYGITLNGQNDYLNAKNLAFWRKSNNTLFGSRIFGIGRDDISGLKQYISESVNAKGYLIGSVEDIALTNVIKQGLVNIPNNHFILFGDNSGPNELFDANSQQVRVLKRKWLSQNTGGASSALIPMDFRFDFTGPLKTALDANPTYKIWMLHDKFVTNGQVSSFDSPYVEYYKPFDVQSVLAFYENVKFDPDQNLYDQFTFGIGPEMIVQVRYDLTNCENRNNPSASITITGGVAPYTIAISHDSVTHTYTIQNNVLVYAAQNNVSYTVVVTDSQNNNAQTTFMPVTYPLDLDLGPDQILSASLTQVTFDASSGIGDPGATYQWYQDGVALAGETNPVFTATEPGEYKVIVIDSNHRCTVSDTVVLSYNFAGTFTSGSHCEGNGYVNLTLSGGVPPYTTVFTGSGSPISYVSNIDIFTVDNIPPDVYTMTTTDAYGSVFQQTVEIHDPLEGLELDVIGYLNQNCSGANDYYNFAYDYYNCPDPLPALDASAQVTYPNVTYQWYTDGFPYSQNPQVDIIPTTSEAQFQEVTIQVLNNDTGCYTSQTFYLYKKVIKEHSEESATKEDIANNNAGNIQAWVYPNPSQSGSTFEYHIKSTDGFGGTVTLYSPTGALIRSIEINGDSTYTLPFELLASGMYLIRTETPNQILTTKILIR